MEINKYHGSYNVSKKSEAYRYIVLHYVGSGTSAPGSARNNCIYFSGGNRNASAHYFIDDGGIWEYADPDVYYTWHCGDGGGAYGITNRNSIGIEVCVNGYNPYTQAEIGYLRELLSHLMSKYGIDKDHVVRHYDASRKQCPYYYVNADNWAALRDQLFSKPDPAVSTWLNYVSNTAIQRWIVHWDDAREWVTLENEATGLYLDLAGGKGESGTNVRAYPYNGQTGQQWRVEQVPGYDYLPKFLTPVRIVPKANPSLALSGVDGKRVPQTGTKVYTADGSAGQDFCIVDQGHNKWVILSNPGMVALEVVQ